MTDELKKAIESAHTEEEKKAVAEKFKDEIKERRHFAVFLLLLVIVNRFD